MSSIIVDSLRKWYRVLQKEPGLYGGIKSLFSRKYKDIQAVMDVSFEIEEGELVGFIGPNGAGKTTTLKCLSGLLYPTEGRISVLGYTPFERKNDFLKQVTLVMGQKNQLWWDLPAMETFLLNKEIYEIRDDLFKITLNKLIELLEMKNLVNIPVRRLSLGERMKAELIAALLHEPKVIFLDEPTIGLDVVMQKKIREFLKEYNRHYKATIILTSHNMDDVKELCERVMIIDRGKIIYDGLLGNVVKKYADHKTISVVFEDYVDPKELEKIGEVKTIDLPKVVFSVKRDQVNLAAAELLRNFPIDDLNIEESDIEDVIREVFTGRDVA
jgi:ABC-2 type transport system ATP-binding protein